MGYDVYRKSKLLTITRPIIQDGGPSYLYALEEFFFILGYVDIKVEDYHIVTYSDLDFSSGGYNGCGYNPMLKNGWTTKSSLVGFGN